MHIDFELKKGDLIKMKQEICFDLKPSLRLLIDTNTKLRISNSAGSKQWWASIPNVPVILIVIDEANIAWVERH